MVLPQPRLPAGQHLSAHGRPAPGTADLAEDQQAGPVEGLERLQQEPEKHGERVSSRLRLHGVRKNFFDYFPVSSIFDSVLVLSDVF